MSVVKFANPRNPTIEGIVAVGAKITTENLIESYDNGIFPWPHQGYPMLWFCPDERGVIDFVDVKPPKSFMKWYRKSRPQFKITMNQNFSEVIKNCKKQKRPGQDGTWITSQIEKTYRELHLLGHAKSLEIWLGDELVGGIYGVQSKKYFSCESMFFKVSNASKLALYELIRQFKTDGVTWMDIQMVTDVSGSFGGKLISKDDFLDRIEK
ncbi:MAG: leucyl/phenylalanyl-tRNA--protein transferase [Bdellovibrio sp.]|nr:leucyl/phenylalanyl-tRNA--protein transferase [Bdellovibrio sp.]